MNIKTGHTECIWKLSVLETESHLSVHVTIVNPHVHAKDMLSVLKLHLAIFLVSQYVSMNFFSVA